MSFGYSGYKKISRKVGFTLAEVLVALTIVGIVAAMVVPAIIGRTNDADSIVKFKQTVSDLSAATKRAALNNGGVIDTSSIANIIDTYGTVMTYIRKDNSITNIMNISYNCYKNNSVICEDTMRYSFSAGAILSNGAVIFLDNIYTSDKCTMSWFDLQNICACIGIDVNGARGPNMEGKDFFWVWLLKKKGEYIIMPVGTDGDNLTCVAGSSNGDTSAGCSTNALMNNLP